MRAIPNLLQEAEILGIARDPHWSPVYGAEILGRALGHEVRYCLESRDLDSGTNYFDIIDPSLPLTLVRHHIADVLA